MPRYRVYLKKSYEPDNLYGNITIEADRMEETADGSFSFMKGNEEVARYSKAAIDSWRKEEEPS